MAVAFVLVGLVTALDFVTGWELSFSIFYLAPISIVTWSIGRRAGLPLAVLSAFAWVAADLMAGREYTHLGIAYWNATSRLGFFVLAVLGLSTLKRALVYARTDPLTGLPNRRAFQEVLHAELTRARRYARALTVAYIDIDGFKRVNDRLGHDGGDDMLRKVARTMRESLRAPDVVARLGGDEFALMLPEADTSSALATLEKIHGALVAAVAASRPSIGFSIGAVTYLSPPDSEGGVMRHADQLMYQAKEGAGGPIRHEEVEPSPGE
jgi:diguanylate cyclase (GGDEF)-like protein